jgi:hypothetical protein
MFGRVMVFLVCLLCATAVDAQKNLLSQHPLTTQLSSVLVAVDQWKPFPTAADRAAWEAFPQEVREGYIRRGEEALDYAWPALKATDFLGFVRTGDRSHYEGLRSERRRQLQVLVMAEVMEGKGRFMDQIANGVWATCEETWWGVPAHVGAQKAGSGLPDIDEPVIALFAAETAAQMAWTVYLLGPQLEKVSPFIVPRIRREINRQLLAPGLARDDFWWMGFGDREVNNWNPWINSNWLTCVLLMEKDADRRTQSVVKILRSLDNFLNHYPADGGCDEGPGYWGRAGASLFDCLELMYSATNGKFTVYDNALVQNIGQYIYRVHIDDSYFVNFADASPRAGGSSDLIYRYGQRINDPKMMAFGAWIAQQGRQRAQRPGDGQQQRQRRGGFGGASNYRSMVSVFDQNDLQNVADARPPYLRDVWFPHLQVFVARDQEGSSQGFYVAAKGGHNAESHNHNDVGNFIVYRDGLPVLIDVGVGTYTAKTFSPQRYDIWTMQSAYHNLPTINGVMQKNGREFAAKELGYEQTDVSAKFSLDIAGAYPSEAGVTSWKRTVQLHRGKSLEIVDSYDLNKRAKDMTLTLMTPCDVTIVEPGKLMLKGAEGQFGQATIIYDAKKLKAVTEKVALDDERLSRGWDTNQLTRILLKATSPPKKDTWTVTVMP